jgi:hypothetical protein
MGLILSAESNPPKLVIIKADIKGAIIPAIEVIVRFNDKPVIRSLLLSEAIEIICEGGDVIRNTIVSQTPINMQNGQDAAKKRIKPTGIANALLTMYCLLKFFVLSVNQPEGNARIVFMRLLILRINPNSTVDAPKRLTNMDQYSPPPIGSIPGGPLPPANLPRVSLAKKTLKFLDCRRQKFLKSSNAFNTNSS